MTAEREADRYAGFHQFQRASRDIMDDPEPYGSFKVFWRDDGWYWVAGFPDNTPTSDEIGPFDTSDEAFADAQENA